MLATLLLVVGGLALHWPFLGAPLLEGAAGKQTHTAMIARNFYRGRSALLRPVVDDLGAPGYFVKEAPLLAAATALVYSATGQVDETSGRLLSLLAWLCAVPLVLSLLRRGGPDGEAFVAAAWWVLAPLAFVYASAFMSDAAMVSASVAALLAMIRWREAPSAARALAAGALLALALLLKPHAVFWLAPASLVALFTRADGVTRPSRGPLVILSLTLAAGCVVAATWYLHAASVHRAFPAPGATRLDGWFDAPALLAPAFYGELARQLVWMIFTPIGVLLAALGVLATRRGWHGVERALLAWGAGVLVQCAVFDTRLFDDYARGTEYYQLAMVPVAGMLIGRGLQAVRSLLGDARRATRATILVLILVLLAGGVVREVRSALALPERYQRILPDCAQVRTLTQPRDEIFVLADRGGTILYYCDRRGTTFVPARAVQKVFARGDAVAGTKQLADALDRASYVYVPFPELLGEGSPWLAMFERDWARIPTPGTEARLYRRRAAHAD